MKKTLFIIAACVLAAVSCQKEMAVENGIGSEGILTVTADIAQFGADTKTSIDGAATTIKPVWSVNDSIKLFNTDNQAFVYIVKSTDAGKASAEFVPKTDAFSGTFACAYYPADTAKYVHGTGIITGIPDTQAYVAPATAGANAGTFANGSFPMVGTGTLIASKGNLNLTFKNVFGLIQLNFTGSEIISEINLKSEKSLSGTATIATDGSYTITNGKKYVTLTFETPVTLDNSTATAFYIAVPADSTVSRVYVTTGTSLQYKKKDIKASRSQIASLNSATLTSAGFTAVTYSEASTLTPLIINGTVWAPVNSGYDATNYKYGKLYQFGRAVGGGYNNSSDTNNNDAGGIIQEMEKTASVSTDTPNTNPAGNVFYLGLKSDYDWYINTSDNSKQLQSWPMKSGDAGYVAGKIANPCPAGWRVPTYDELNALLGGANKSSLGGLQTDTRSGSPTYNMSGLFFDGTTTLKPTNGVFLPAAGRRLYTSGKSYNRGSSGLYWSSTVDGSKARNLKIDSSDASVSATGGYRASGYSVRCVQE